MPKILRRTSNKIEAPPLFRVPELEPTEVERILRYNPEASKKFIEACAKGEIDWDSFTAAERGIMLNGCIDAAFNTRTEIAALKALREADWVRTPATPEEFLEDPKYLGPIGPTIYKPWKDDLRYVLDSKNEIHEWILSGGIGVGKTRIAIISQLYKLHFLTCMKNIPLYFGLDPATKISFGLFTISLGKAETALSDDFKKIISLSPYFKSIFPLKKMRTMRKVMNTQGESKDEEYEVTLPQGLRILMGSKVSHALSLAVVSAILDEMNFRGKRTVKSEDDSDSAEALYDEIRSRISSRFFRLGHVPGILCVVSSKKTSSDFLESHIAKVKNDPHTYISNYSQWDVKPESYSGKRFYVFIGSSKTSSHILNEEELELYPKDTPNIISVPSSLRRDFDYDVNTALRQFAGIATSPTQLLFEDPLLIRKVWDYNRKPVFTQDTIPSGLKLNKAIAQYLDYGEFFRDAGFTIVPRHHPQMLRVMHIDLSKSKDVTGIAMGGVSAIKEVVTRNAYGQLTVSSYVPEIWIDFVIGLKAVQGDQVDYEKIQQFINYLRNSRFRIHYITFDRFQGVAATQMLLKDGFNVDYRSVDTDDLSYVLLRETVVSKNISIYHHPILERELVNLSHDLSRGKAKVDHPKMNPDGTYGSKDMADALAGVVANAFALLTDTKKFPDTANVAMANKIITTLYPPQRPSPDMPFYVGNEGELLTQATEDLNPFDFKITK